MELGMKMFIVWSLLHHFGFTRQSSPYPWEVLQCFCWSRLFKSTCRSTRYVCGISDEFLPADHPETASIGHLFSHELFGSTSQYVCYGCEYAFDCCTKVDFAIGLGHEEIRAINGWFHVGCVVANYAYDGSGNSHQSYWCECDCTTVIHTWVYLWSGSHCYWILFWFSPHQTPRIAKCIAIWWHSYWKSSIQSWATIYNSILNWPMRYCIDVICLPVWKGNRDLRSL